MTYDANLHDSMALTDAYQQICSKAIADACIYDIATLFELEMGRCLAWQLHAMQHACRTFDIDWLSSMERVRHRALPVCPFAKC